MLNDKLTALSEYKIITVDCFQLCGTFGVADRLYSDRCHFDSGQWFAINVLGHFHR